MGKKTKTILCIVLIINIAMSILIVIHVNKTEDEIQQEVDRRIDIMAKQIRYDVLIVAWPSLTFEEYNSAYKKSLQTNDLKKFWKKQHEEWRKIDLDKPYNIQSLPIDIRMKQREKPWYKKSK